MIQPVSRTDDLCDPGLCSAQVPMPDLLFRMRRAAARSRARARLDLFGACAMLSTDPDTAGGAYLDTFLRTIEQGLGRPPVFFCDGCPQISFDERWVLALFAAQQRGDRDSFAFLLCSRLQKFARRHIAFLIAGMARADAETRSDPAASSRRTVA